ncbi:MAG: hypothetical protein IT437_14210 [Phycisphaerales bacterium]|nr:hypothetical protein [Phycisphaerales bacterium]
MSSPEHPRQTWLALWGPAVLLGVLLVAAAWPLIAAGDTRGRGAFDSVNYHLPVARLLESELPRPDLSNYNVTTTPGYHLLLAAAIRAGWQSDASLRTLTLVIALGLLATLARACAGRAGPLMAMACCLPVACSPYVFQSGAWALPDDLGWWGVLGVMLVALVPRFDARWLCAGGALLLAVVLIRQVHAWAAAMLWAAAWIGPRAEDTGWVSLTEHVRNRSRRAALAAAACVPAAAALSYFVWLWHGLTPPSFRDMYDGLGPSAPCFILALLAVFSVFFVGFWGAAAVRLCREQTGLVLLSGAIGFLAAVLPVTTESSAIPGYRNSGLWHAAGMLGTVGDRTSVLMVLLSTCGGMAAVAWGAALSFRDRWVMAAGLAAFMAAQSASPMVWQRYNEPLLLIACAVAACRIGPAGDRRVAALRLTGPAALAVLLAGLAWWIIAGSEPTADFHIDPRTGRSAATW